MAPKNGDAPSKALLQEVQGLRHSDDETRTELRETREEIKVLIGIQRQTLEVQKRSLDSQETLRNELRSGLEALAKDIQPPLDEIRERVRRLEDAVFTPVDPKS